MDNLVPSPKNFGFPRKGELVGKSEKKKGSKDSYRPECLRRGLAFVALGQREPGLAQSVEARVRRCVFPYPPVCSTATAQGFWAEVRCLRRVSASSCFSLVDPQGRKASPNPSQK